MIFSRGSRGQLTHPDKELRLFISSHLNWLKELGTGLLVLLGSLLAALPLFRYRFPSTRDGLEHLKNIVELDSAWQQHIWYPRWFPDTQLGFGSPNLHYYAPLLYFRAEFIHLLGFDFLQALTVTAALTYPLAGLSMYLLSREVYRPYAHLSHHTRAAALLSALVYAYSPYFIFDVFTRGAWAEAQAYALLPLVLWSLHRLIETVRFRYVPVVATTLALFLLSHTLISYFGSYFIGIYTLCLLMLFARHWRLLVFLPMACSLAIGSSLFFTGPALLDLPLLQGTTSELAQDYIVTLHPWSDLVQLNLTYLLDLHYRVTLVQGLLVALALPALISATRRRGMLLFYFFSLPLLLWLETRAALPAWRWLPLSSYIQFTWRLLGLITIELAILSGSALLLPVYRTVRRIRWIIPLAAALLSGAILVGNLRDAQVNPQEIYLPQVNAAQIDSVGDWWNSGWALRTLQAHPTDLQKIAEQLRMNGQGQFGYIWVEEQGRYSFTIETRFLRPEQLLWHCFYFPGWRAWIDDQEVTVTPATILGVVSFEAPQGRHIIRLSFGDTPLWSQLNTISLGSCALLLFLYSALLLQWVFSPLGPLRITSLWPDRWRPDFFQEPDWIHSPATNTAPVSITSMTPPPGFIPMGPDQLAQLAHSPQPTVPFTALSMVSSYTATPEMNYPLPLQAPLPLHQPEGITSPLTQEKSEPQHTQEDNTVRSERLSLPPDLEQTALQSSLPDSG